MRDANENILKVIVNNVHESVEFLEKFVSTCAAESLNKPTSECFRNQQPTSAAAGLANTSQPTSLSQDTPNTTTTGGIFSFDWDKSNAVEFNDVKNLVRNTLIHSILHSNLI